MKDALTIKINNDNLSPSIRQPTMGGTPMDANRELFITWLVANVMNGEGRASETTFVQYALNTKMWEETLPHFFVRLLQPACRAGLLSYSVEGDDTSYTLTDEGQRRLTLEMEHLPKPTTVHRVAMAAHMLNPTGWIKGPALVEFLAGEPLTKCSEDLRVWVTHQIATAVDGGWLERERSVEKGWLYRLSPAGLHRLEVLGFSTYPSDVALTPPKFATKRPVRGVPVLVPHMPKPLRASPTKGNLQPPAPEAPAMSDNTPTPPDPDPPPPPPVLPPEPELQSASTTPPIAISPDHMKVAVTIEKWSAPSEPSGDRGWVSQRKVEEELCKNPQLRNGNIPKIILEAVLAGVVEFKGGTYRGHLAKLRVAPAVLQQVGKYMDQQADIRRCRYAASRMLGIRW